MQQRNSERICQHGPLTSASLFLFGLAVGSTAALLLAPFSGRHLRRALGGRVDEGRRAVNTQAREAWDKASGVAEEVATKVEAGKRYVAQEGRRMGAAIHAGKEAYQSASPTQTEMDSAAV